MREHIRVYYMASFFYGIIFLTFSQISGNPILYDYIHLDVSNITIIRPLDYRFDESNGISENYELNYIRKEIDHGNWKQVYVTLSPYHWRVPHGLNDQWLKWFWNQPENWRHFNDSKAPITGVVRIIKNGTFSGSFQKLSNTTHYINFNTPPTFSNTTENETVMYITNHEVQYFQHFFDNGIPHIMLMLFASQLDPSEVTIRISSCLSGTITNTLKKWGFKKIVISGGEFSASTLILPEIVPVIHPLYHRKFKKYFNINYTEYNKIIFISRKPNDQCKDQRIIINQDSLTDSLFKKYGNRFILFKASGYSYEGTVSLFSKAAAIIGAHGGAMYNQMFSPPNASIIEIMPIGYDGLYAGQKRPKNMPPFAHLAIHTNSMMLGQTFYRYYQPTAIKNQNMEINIDDFIEWFSHIIK